MEVENYIYVRVNKFNLIWPDEPPDFISEFPLTNWFRGIRVEGKTVHKIVFILCVSWPLITSLGLIDFGIWLLKKGVEMVIYILKTFFDSFGRKFFGILGIAVIGFLIFVLCKSGLWQNVYDELVKLFS